MQSQSPRFLAALAIILCSLISAHAAELDSLPLIRLDQQTSEKTAPFQLRSDTRYLAFYYSASWCPPCRTTTPALVDEYQRMLAKDAMPVEFILVSGDRSEQGALDYMEHYKMPWPALAWDSRGLANAYAARGIPHLALVEIASGKLIAQGTGTSIDSVVDQIREITGVTTGKPFRAGSLFGRYGMLIVISIIFIGTFILQKIRRSSRASNAPAVHSAEDQ